MSYKEHGRRFVFSVGLPFGSRLSKDVYSHMSALRDAFIERAEQEKLFEAAPFEWLSVVVSVAYKSCPFVIFERLGAPDNLLELTVQVDRESVFGDGSAGSEFQIEGIRNALQVAYLAAKQRKSPDWLPDPRNEAMRRANR